MTEKIVRLEIDGPTATCGNCHFTNPLDGEWKMSDGVLTFRAKQDPLPSRGPSIDHCGECGAEFTQLETDHAAVPEIQYNLIKTIARHGRFIWQRDLMDPGDGNEPL